MQTKKNNQFGIMKYGSKSGSVNPEIDYSDQNPSRIQTSIYQKYRRNKVNINMKELSV